jgi:hypothetical protein
MILRPEKGGQHQVVKPITDYCSTAQNVWSLRTILASWTIGNIKMILLKSLCIRRDIKMTQPLQLPSYDDSTPESYFHLLTRIRFLFIL